MNNIAVTAAGKGEFRRGWRALLAEAVDIAGAATTAVACSRIVNTWFGKSRGLAPGITMADTGVTAFLLPLIRHRVIAAGRQGTSRVWR